jgi:membrane protease YdiL (CAAX protease family)
VTKQANGIGMFIGSESMKWLNMIPQSLILVLLALVLRPSLLNEKPSIWTPVIALAPTVVIGIVSGLIIRFRPSIKHSHDTYRVRFKDRPFWFDTLMGISAGIGEEFFFRGVLQHALGNGIIAVLLASAAFGFVHDGWRKATMKYAVIAGVYGLVLGVTYALTKDLWAVALSHAAVNTLASFSEIPKVE